MEEKIKIKAIKISLLGDSTVGKTAISYSFLNVEFREGAILTVGIDKLNTNFTLKSNKKIKLIIWDTAGQERFQSLALRTLTTSHGVILVFDVSNRSSFININKWLEKIEEQFNDPCIVLFGNKVDLDKNKWQVTNEEIDKLVKAKNLAYFETSAKAKIGIDEGFSYIVNEAYDKIKGKSNENIIIEKENVENENKEIKKKDKNCACSGSEKKKNV